MIDSNPTRLGAEPLVVALDDFRRWAGEMVDQAIVCRARKYRYSLDALRHEMGHPNNCEMARRLDVGVRQVQRWREEGGLTERHADRAACRLNLHPSLIWPEWWKLYRHERYVLTDEGRAALRLVTS